MGAQLEMDHTSLKLSFQPTYKAILNLLLNCSCHSLWIQPIYKSGSTLLLSSLFIFNITSNSQKSCQPKRNKLFAIVNQLVMKFTEPDPHVKCTNVFEM